MIPAKTEEHKKTGYEHFLGEKGTGLAFS